MKRITTMTVIAIVSALALSAPASASEVKQLAKQDCRVEAKTDTAEFKALYGGTGKAAVNRCARQEVREARADCKGDRAEEPNEFALEYGGTDSAAIKRCMIDELR